MEASIRGIVTQGFDYEKARSDLIIYDEFDVTAMIAIGKRAPREKLPANLQEKEFPKGRKPLSEIIMEGSFKE